MALSRMMTSDTTASRPRTLITVPLIACSTVPSASQRRHWRCKTRRAYALTSNTNNMRNLRHRYTYAERLEFQDTLLSMRLYVLPLLLARQNGTCNLCHEPHTRYDIDHMVYNPMITINELQALCEVCHKGITNFTTMGNR